MRCGKILTKTLSLLLCVPLVAGAHGVTLVANGRSGHVIVVSPQASPSEQWAARDLADHLKQMSGAVLRVETGVATLPEKAICIGDSAAVRGLGVVIDAKKLGTDGFVIRTLGQRLIIAGGRERGTMYGVYEVLAKLGCRWWAPGASTIPKMRTIVVKGMDMEKTPVLEYRDVLYGDLWEGTRNETFPEGNEAWQEGRKYCARNHLNARFHEMPEWLGPIEMDQGIAHGVTRFLPSFKEHPEYWCLIKGSRVERQPCWSNEDAAKAAAANVIKVLDQHPKWRLITLGQEDESSICECDNCKALVAKYGANSALCVTFANNVARIVKEKYSHVLINTNAYRWSQKAPKGLVCDDNVMITLPPIACNYAQPLVEGYPQENADYKKDMEDWGKICTCIYVWDYTTDFVSYVMPFPNFYVLQPNIKFFVGNNAKGVFEQGSHTTNNGQFSKLVMWVSSQAMWNPDADGKKLVEEFCLGYYGPKAGPLVLEYVNMLEEKVTKERIPIWATHRTFLSAPHLTPEMMAKGEQLFRKAEAAVKGDPVMLKRVEVAHFPVQYMLLRRSNVYWEPAKKANPGLKLGETAVQLARVGRENHIARLSEGDGAEPFYAWVTEWAKEMEKDPKSCLPEEVRGLDPATYVYLPSPQFDGQVRFMKKVDGSLTGWAQNVVTYGWSITDFLGAGKDFTPGKKYTCFARVKGSAKPGAAPAAGSFIEIGIYTGPTGARPTGNGDVKLLDGAWHTIPAGTWTPSENGGTIYVCLNQKTAQSVQDVYIDGFWMIEAPAAPAK